MNLEMTWTPHPKNPLIAPRWPEWLLGDPVVLPPESAPDDHWHMFLNSILFIYHYTSRDGIAWKRRRRVCHGMRAFLFKNSEDDFYLFYEMNITFKRSVIMARRSRDLWRWGAPKKILCPELPWEKETARVMSCPCVVRAGDGFRLYYSTDQVFLEDLGFPEPRYIGYAESDDLLGPYRKNQEPLFGPEPHNPWRNCGAGAIKVYRDEEKNRFVGFNNGIYMDEKGRSRSAIMALTSPDGIEWTERFHEPIIMPSMGWKRALVYQLDAVPRPNGELWLYYNARDGWRIGVERIGLEIGRPKGVSK